MYCYKFFCMCAEKFYAKIFKNLKSKSFDFTEGEPHRKSYNLSSCRSFFFLLCFMQEVVLSRVWRFHWIQKKRKSDTHTGPSTRCFNIQENVYSQELLDITELIFSSIVCAPQKADMALFSIRLNWLNWFWEVKISFWLIGAFLLNCFQIFAASCWKMRSWGQV